MLAIATLAAPASAKPNDVEQYLTSYGEPATGPGALTTDPALAVEQSYSSYGSPKTLAAPLAPTNGSDTLLIVALTVGGMFVLVGTGLAGRHWTTRRRHAVPA